MAAIPLIIENQHDGQWYVIDLPDNWIPEGGVITITAADPPIPNQERRPARTRQADAGAEAMIRS